MVSGNTTHDTLGLQFGVVSDPKKTHFEKWNAISTSVCIEPFRIDISKQRPKRERKG